MEAAGVCAFLPYLFGAWAEGPNQSFRSGTYERAVHELGAGEPVGLINLLFVGLVRGATSGVLASLLLTFILVFTSVHIRLFRLCNSSRVCAGTWVIHHACAYACGVSEHIHFVIWNVYIRKDPKQSSWTRAWLRCPGKPIGWAAGGQVAQRRLLGTVPVSAKKRLCKPNAEALQ